MFFFEKSRARLLDKEIVQKRLALLNEISASARAETVSELIGSQPAGLSNEVAGLRWGRLRSARSPIADFFEQKRAGTSGGVKCGNK